MGIVSSPLLDLKSIIQGNDKEKCKLSESLRNKVLEAQAKRGSSSWQLRKKRVTRKNGHIKTRRILMKKRARLEGSRRPATVIKKVKTLKKLIPNGEPLGLDGLFRETADYILALQMRVKVMQIMVNVLTGSEE